jgi:hypothetical protein
MLHAPAAHPLYASTVGVANPGPAGHFKLTRSFKMASEDFMIHPYKKNYDVVN